MPFILCFSGVVPLNVVIITLFHKRVHSFLKVFLLPKMVVGNVRYLGHIEMTDGYFSELLTQVNGLQRVIVR